jgi:hypothetical protein
MPVDGPWALLHPATPAQALYYLRANSDEPGAFYSVAVLSSRLRNERST